MHWPFALKKSVTLQLKLILKVLAAFDPEHASTLSSFYEEVPIFAVPWLLTWFAHSLRDMDQILRIYDFLLSSPPQTIIYMCAALLIITKEELVNSTEELDMPAVHQFYQKIDIPDVELLIATTIEMERKCDIGMQVLALDTPLPEGSLIASFESQKNINKYYKHDLRLEAIEMLNKSESVKPDWKKQVVVNFGIAGLLLTQAVIAYKAGSKKLVETL